MAYSMTMTTTHFLKNDSMLVSPNSIMKNPHDKKKVSTDSARPLSFCDSLFLSYLLSYLVFQFFRITGTLKIACADTFFQIVFIATLAILLLTYIARGVLKIFFSECIASLIVYAVLFYFLARCILKMRDLGKQQSVDENTINVNMEEELFCKSIRISLAKLYIFFTIRLTIRTEKLFAAEEKVQRLKSLFFSILVILDCVALIHIMNIPHQTENKN